LAAAVQNCEKQAGYHPKQLRQWTARNPRRFKKFPTREFRTCANTKTAFIMLLSDY